MKNLTFVTEKARNLGKKFCILLSRKYLGLGKDYVWSQLGEYVEIRLRKCNMFNINVHCDMYPG
jgi:hypothetical protein